jgi:alanyl-tRNA synthetase
VSCAIADGILPGNEGRNYVIRRILRRGIMYGQKNLGLKTGDFSALVAPVIESLGDVFPELKDPARHGRESHPRRGRIVRADTYQRTGKV